MVIVHVLTRLLRAGSEENTLASCRSQAAAGHNVVIVHGCDFDSAVRREAEKVATVVTVATLVHPISLIRDVRAVREMTRLFRHLGADIVHTHQSKAGILGRLAARLAGIPKIVHGVHILPFVNVGRAQGAIYVAAERFCARFTDAFISVSPSVRDVCINCRIGAPERHFVAFSAMDVDRFKNASPPNDWRELLNVAVRSDQPPTAVMLAAFEPRKRQIEFIRALPDAMSALPKWRMIFAGDGETLSEAKVLAAELGLSDKIHFAGYRSDPEAIIALADVCILTSLREGLPRVLVQYAAAGKPAVVSHLPGVEDIVQDGISAVITPGDDVPAAARALARLLVDIAARSELSKGAKAIDIDAWSFANMNKAVEFAYFGSANAERESK